MMVLLNRDEYWQGAFLVPKGGDRRLRAQPIGAFRAIVAQLAPFLADRVDELTSWDDVST